MFGQTLKFSIATLAAASFVGSANAGLLGHWTFDENTGNTAADSSGNGLTATHKATAAWDTGVSGSAAVNPEFTLGVEANSASLKLADGLTAFTISLWVKTTTNDDFATLAGFEGQGSTGDRYSLKVSSGNVQVTPGGASAASPIATLSNDEWVHIVGVNDPTAGVSRMYVNGVQSGSDGSVVNLSSSVSQFTMGTFWNSTGFDYTGAMDDVQVYDEALSASDVSFLFNNAGTAIPEPGSLALLGLGGLLVASRRRRD